MNPFRRQPDLKQLGSDFLQYLSNKQSENLVGGVSESVIFALNQPSRNSATFDEPSGSIVECLVFDLGGDAVIAEGSTFFTKLPFISSMSRPQ